MVYDQFNIIHSYYRSIQTIIICFGVTNPDLFENIKKKWKSEIDRYACENALIIIVGTKCNLPIKVDLDIIREYANSINAPFLLCSVKTDKNVNEVFEKMASWIQMILY